MSELNPLWYEKVQHTHTSTDYLGDLMSRLIHCMCSLCGGPLIRCVYLIVTSIHFCVKVAFAVLFSLFSLRLFVLVLFPALFPYAQES